MLLPLLAASLVLQGGRTVELTKGAVVSGDPMVPAFTYWDTEDTTLDSSDPDACRGAEPTIIGGPSSVILIRFGDLGRALGSTHHIRSATLHLTIASGDKADLTGISRLLQPWGEGPYQTVNQTIRLLGQQETSKPAATQVPKMAATWRAREAGFDNGNWQLPGARGALDSRPISGATAVLSGKEIQIQGLGKAFQWFADHPSHNCGIALSFSNRIEFYSAQSDKGRPRLELELDDAARPTGPDLRVESIARKTGGGFVAHVRNLGDGPAASFDAVWSMNGRVGSTVNQPKALAPGEELTLSTSEVPRADPADPRSGTVGLDVTPVGGEGIGLTVFSQARTIDFVIDPAVAQKAKSSPNFEGTKAIEDWVQGEVRVFNETYLAQSRYSFALDGAKSRVSVQSISLDAPDPSEQKGESRVVVTPGLYEDGKFSLPMEKAIGQAIGLIDYGAMNVSARSGRIALAGASDRGAEDRFPGLMGGGDTRWDGDIPGVMMISEQTLYTPDDPIPVGDPCGLLALTDVYMLDSSIGKPIAPGLPSVAPKSILLLARDLQLQPLAGAALSFYQSSGSKIADGPPVFTLKVPDTGDVPLPNRDAESVFGKLNPDGSNGLMLVKAELNGVTEWGFVKAWQIVDAYARGIALAGILTLTFDLPSTQLETDEDLASQKFVTDSTGLSPDKLGMLIGGAGKAAVTLGSKAGDWVEVDLGRDRTLAEIRLTAGEGFWRQFDILLYGTGQRPAEAQLFARERDWAFARRNRSDGPAADATVSYRGAPVQVRFIRIVNRSGGPGEISKISVIPAKVSN